MVYGPEIVTWAKQINRKNNGDKMKTNAFNDLQMECIKITKHNNACDVVLNNNEDWSLKL